MAVNKVDFAGNTLIDLTGDTVTPETLAKDVTAHNAAGQPIVGTKEFSINDLEETTLTVNGVYDLSIAVVTQDGFTAGAPYTTVTTKVYVGNFFVIKYYEGGWGYDVISLNNLQIITNLNGTKVFFVTGSNPNLELQMNSGAGGAG